MTDKRIIAGIAHVCYGVSDLEASIAFYCDKLGLEPAFDFRRPDGTKFGQYIHAGGRCFIELFVGDVQGTVEGQSYRHLCLEVEDIEYSVATLRERGVEVTDIKMGSDNAQQAWITDPDGNRIELHGYTNNSKQLRYIR